MHKHLLGAVARNVRNNAANQVMAGWVPTGGLIEVGSSGSYTVNPLGGEAGTQPQVLRLRKTDTNDWYFVSMRQALGLDAGLSSASRASSFGATARSSRATPPRPTA